MINIKKKLIIFLAVLTVFIMTSPIYANENITDVDVGETYLAESEPVDLNEVPLQENDDDVVEDEVIISANESSVEENEVQKTSLKTDDKNVVYGEYFHVKLTDEKGNGISNKMVLIGVSGKTYHCISDNEGIAKLKICLSNGQKSITCNFEGDDGYTSSSLETKILVIPSNKAKLTVTNSLVYRELGGYFKVVLKVGDMPLESRKIKVGVVGKVYTITTNSKGEAKLPIHLKSKTYPLTYTFEGEQNIAKVSGSINLVVKDLTPTKLTVVSSTNFRKGIIAPFIVKLTDNKNNPIKNKVVYITVAGKTYHPKTDSSGMASLPIGLNVKTYAISYSVPNDAPYKASKGSTKIVVYPPIKGNGAIWVNGYSMKSVNFNTLANNGISNIFLNEYSFKLYGKTTVLNWIKNAGYQGLKVHIWMQVFYDGGWIVPVNKDGSYKTSFMTSKINTAKSYATMAGVAGVHLDYLRFGGTAYKYKNSAAAINYFAKKCSDTLHKVKPGCIVSAAVMPEPSSNKYYYGQDISTLSKSLDIIVPMVYKGNYRAGTNWIKTTTSALVKQANGGAQIWTGLQTYRSDSDVTKLTYSQLYKDAQAAKNGGAKGVALFRFGLTQFININKLFK